MTDHSPFRLLVRGVAKRCPWCGAGRLFVRWFDMKPNCPRCGYRFEREEGFFLGAYVINLALTEVMVGAVFIALIVREAQGWHGSLVPWLLVVGAVQVALPFVSYPFSKTIWAAFDLIMHPSSRSRRPKQSSAGRRRTTKAPGPRAESMGGALWP